MRDRLQFDDNAISYEKIDPIPTSVFLYLTGNPYLPGDIVQFHRLFSVALLPRCSVVHLSNVTVMLSRDAR